VRRALLISLVVLFVLIPARAEAAEKSVHLAVGGGAPNPSQVTINGGDSVKWTNDDAVPHHIFIDGGDVSGPIATNETFSQSFPDPGDSDATVTYHIDSASGTPGTVTVKAATTTTTTSTTQPTTTTKSTTTTSSSTTTSTSDTTTTSSSTTTTAPNSSFSNFSGPIAIQDKGGKSGGSSALPLLLGAFVVVAGLAGLAYWMWTRSGEPYDDEGPDWTQEPPPTVQGPRI
jgi:plastocyanin